MGGEGLGSRECRECASGWPHCHGTLICHPGGFWQCTELHCADPEVVLHSLRIDCEVLGCDCLASVVLSAI